MRLPVSRGQAVAYRLAVHHLSRRLPAGSYVEAARFGLQDTAPRDALLGLHARVESCEPDGWADPRLVQTYSPRAAVYLLPREDFGVFTIGRLPLDPGARRRIEQAAETVCRALNGREVRGAPVLQAREACASGRIAVRWTTSALYVREVPRPEVDVDEARTELLRRYIHAFGPATPASFAWWAGVPVRDANQTWQRLARELVPAGLCGQQAWILTADEPLLTAPPPMRGARLLVAPDLRLLGQDRTGLFAGPGLRRHTPLQDSFHPNGVLVDGRIIGAWGRRAGHIRVKVAGTLSQRTRDAITAEATSCPVTGARVSIADS